MCANQKLLTDVLRGEWQFDGYVTSDCGAINDIVANHKFAPDAQTATAMGLKAGCDTDCGGVYGGSLVKAVNDSILSEATVDVSLRRLAKIQMRLGLFAPKAAQPYFDKARYGIDQIDTPAHQQLAYEAALQSIVLLKNDAQTLPLKKGLKIALVGPHVHGNEVFLSNYHGSRCADNSYNCIPSPLQAITKLNAGGTTVGVPGVDVDSKTNNISAAVAAASAADAVVMLVGIDGRIEGEEHDRYNCTLPGLQPQLLAEVGALKKPTVMVLIHGGAMCLGALKASVPAIVDAFYGGERGAEAIAAVLFGDHNPTGKLPITMYPPEYMYQIPLTQMSVSAPPGRTHMYYSGTPDFAFGSGLSYSQFEIAMADAPRDVAIDHVADAADAADGHTDAAAVSYAIRLTNRGPFVGGQRVLVFARPKGSAAPKGSPRQRLCAYRAVAPLAVGASVDLNIALTFSSLASANSVGERVVLPGEYEIVISDGASQLSTRLFLSGSPKVVEKSALAK